MTRTPLTTSLDRYEVWFLTGSQHLYGPETLKQVADQSRQVAETLGAASGVPVKVVWKPVLTDSEAIRRTALEANAADDVIGLVAWMHTFSPAKMWISGLDALQKPLAHLHTQANVELPWGEIDFDFMNLNQAAHGDREFGYIQTRLGVPRKTIVGHASDPRVQAEFGTWQRAAAGPRGIPQHEARPLRRQHALRRGDRGRQDRGRAALRRAGQHVGRERARRGGRRGIRGRRRRARRRVRGALRGRARAAEGRRPPPVAARRRRDRARPALVPRGGRLRRLHHVVRGPRRPEAAAGPRGAAPHGRGLRLRRRGRLEDRRARAHRERHGRRAPRRRLAHGGLHLRPHARRRAHPRRAHARGLAVAHHDEADPRDPPARHRRQGGPRAPRVHRRPRPRRRRRDERHARSVPPHGERRRERRAAASAAEAARGPRRVEARPRLPDQRRRMAHRGCRAPHGDVDRGRRRRVPRLRRDGDGRTARDRRSRPPCPGSSARCAGTRPTTAWRRASERGRHERHGCPGAHRPSRMEPAGASGVPTMFDVARGPASRTRRCRACSTTSRASRHRPGFAWSRPSPSSRTRRRRPPARWRSGVRDRSG